MNIVVSEPQIIRFSVANFFVGLGSYMRGRLPRLHTTYVYIPSYNKISAAAVAARVVVVVVLGHI